MLYFSLGHQFSLGGRGCLYKNTGRVCDRFGCFKYLLVKIQIIVNIL